MNFETAVSRAISGKTTFIQKHTPGKTKKVILVPCDFCDFIVSDFTS